MLPFKIEKSGHTHGMLWDLPPGTAAAESKWQFSHFKSTRPQSDTRVHFRLFLHLLYIIKAHVISAEGDQPSWFSQEWGCSQDMRLLVLKLEKCQANQDELVTQLPTLPVAVCLSFTPLVILMIFIYSLILQSPFLLPLLSDLCSWDCPVSPGISGTIVWHPLLAALLLLRILPLN